MMKKLIFLYLLPFYSFAQFTYVPDDNFEQELINLGVDWVFDDYVETSGIDTITYLYMYSYSITDMTCISHFPAL